MPPAGQGVLGILAFIPALFALPETPIRKVWVWGWIGGALWEAGTLWWLVPTITNYGGLPLPVAAVLVGLLSLVLGVYTLGYLVTLRLLCERRGEWGLTFAPLAWILWEWLRGWLFGGMPWWGPGYGLTTYLTLLQCVRLTGVLGLSALVVLLATAVALWLRDRRGTPVRLTLPLAVVACAAAFGYGLWRERQPAPDGPIYRVAFLQPEVSQSAKWDPEFAQEIQARLWVLTQRYANHGVKLFVWPESCTPLDWEGDGKFRSETGDLAGGVDAPILLGSVVGAGKGYQNAAVVVLPGGGEGGRYAKTHLVPFGEYVPLNGFFGLAKPFVQAVGDFSPGRSLAPLEVNGAKVGVTICFEGVFPRLVRKEVLSGADLIVNITNDAWYAGTPGPMQHFLLERVRAVELGRCLVRSANGGISGLVGPDGRLEETTEQGRPDSGWGNARLLSEKTLYSRIGDHWLWIALFAVAAGFCRSPLKGR